MYVEHEAKGSFLREAHRLRDLVGSSSNIATGKARTPLQTTLRNRPEHPSSGRCFSIETMKISTLCSRLSYNVDVALHNRAAAFEAISDLSIKYFEPPFICRVDRARVCGGRGSMREVGD